MEWRQWIALLRLEAGELDHLSPLLGFLCDELFEVWYGQSHALAREHLLRQRCDWMLGGGYWKV